MGRLVLPGGMTMNPSLLRFKEGSVGRQLTTHGAMVPSMFESAARRFAAPLLAILALASGPALASDADDRRALAELDARYQRAVLQNDATTMAAILADGFVLVSGDGTRSGKADLIRSATDGRTRYEHQEDTERAVVVSGDTGVVTARLRVKGVEDGQQVDYTLWFSDVYLRTPAGWRYWFAQASLPLPGAAKH